MGPLVHAVEAHNEYVVTFCGTGVKRKPRLSDITIATALKEVTPSGTVIFPLVQVLSSLTEMKEKKKCVHVINCAYIPDNTDAHFNHRLISIMAPLSTHPTLVSNHSKDSVVCIQR